MVFLFIQRKIILLFGYFIDQSLLSAYFREIALFIVQIPLFKFINIPFGLPILYLIRNNKSKLLLIKYIIKK